VPAPEDKVPLAGDLGTRLGCYHSLTSPGINQESTSTHWGMGDGGMWAGVYVSSPHACSLWASLAQRGGESVPWGKEWGGILGEGWGGEGRGGGKGGGGQGRGGGREG